jgi:hypothetical protein
MFFVDNKSGNEILCTVFSIPQIYDNMNEKNFVQELLVPTVQVPILLLCIVLMTQIIITFVIFCTVESTFIKSRAFG